MSTLNVTVTENVGLSPTFYLAIPVGLAAAFSVIPIVTPVRATPMLATDSATLTGAALPTWSAVVRETAALTETFVPNWHTQATAADAIHALASLNAGVPVTLAEHVALSEALLGGHAAVIIERLGLSEVYAPAAILHATLTQGVALRASLARFFGGDVTEALALTEVYTAPLHAHATLAETVEITAAITPRLVLRAVAAEGLELSAAQIVRAIYRDTIAEDVAISAAYVAPDGSFTTWAMNARTGAVTEYDNFEFNSFAQLGSTYVATAADGLYELLGDDDAGTAIIPRIKSGLLQFGGTHLSRLKAAYIATRGEAEFVLKIETGDGAVYNYAASTRGMRSTKVHMGKGQRARYFSFELIGVGDDFDLDTLEFVPIVLQRRV